jgi:hypothetical protein
MEELKESFKRLFPLKDYVGFYYPDEVVRVAQYYLEELNVYFRIAGVSIEVSEYRDDRFPKGYYVYYVRKNNERILFIKEHCKELNKKEVKND